LPLLKFQPSYLYKGLAIGTKETYCPLTKVVTVETKVSKY